MTVYVVIRSDSDDYTSASTEVAKVFANKAAAEVYAIDLQNEEDDRNVEYYVDDWNVEE